eukprot:362213-Chlamydomonas_euryale.AAC.1
MRAPPKVKGGGGSGSGGARGRGGAPQPPKARPFHTLQELLVWRAGAAGGDNGNGTADSSSSSGGSDGCGGGGGGAPELKAAHVEEAVCASGAWVPLPADVLHEIEHGRPRPLLLVCHDMAGGYHEDACPQVRAPTPAGVGGALCGSVLTRRRALRSRPLRPEVCTPLHTHL